MTLDILVRDLIRDSVRDVVRDVVREELRGMRNEALPGNPGIPEIMSLDMVSKLLSVHTETVRGWVKAGRLKSHRIGRGIRIRRDDLEAFMNEDQDTTDKDIKDLAARVISGLPMNRP